MVIDFRLLVIAGPGDCAPTTIPELLDALKEQGVRAFLLRDKESSEDDIRRLIHERHPVSPRIIVHSHITLAEEASLDVHVAEINLPSIAFVRQRRGTDVMIGTSVHSVEKARDAERLGASYLLFGPVFDTPSKRQYGLPQGLSALEQVCESVRIPVFAVGGIQPSNAEACLTSGAWGIACISAVLPIERTPTQISSFRSVIGEL